MEFKNIVLTTDLSPNSAEATPYAVELARKYGGSIHLVHVLEEASYIATTGEDAFAAATASQPGWFELARQKREASLRTLAESLSNSAQVPVYPVFSYGAPAYEIVKTANDLSADCIVIATHGRTGFSHLLFGSVAERVVRISECPVLTIRPRSKA